MSRKLRSTDVQLFVPSLATNAPHAKVVGVAGAYLEI